MNRKSRNSDLSLGEELMNDSENRVQGKNGSHLTFEHYQSMDCEQKLKLQNRVRQWALKARSLLPMDHGMFCLVLVHLLKNAHRYFNMERQSNFQTTLIEDNISDGIKQSIIDDFKEVNKRVREVRDLKCKNRVREQQDLVCELKNNYHSFRNLSFLSGVSLKTVHNWCSKPKEKINKASHLSNLRKKEFEEFLLQDTISFEHPCKKFSGKRFLRDTLDVTRSKYLQQSQYHKNGIISMSSMKAYRPSYIMLCGKTPLDQCLCDKCENCEQLIKALIGIGMKNVPSNRYSAVNCVVCPERIEQSGTEFKFPRKECLNGNCEQCGEASLAEKLRSSNQTLFNDNKTMTWRKWVSKDKSAPVKCQLRGRVSDAVEELINILKKLKSHLFRANWNRNTFDYIRRNLVTGYVVQIFDFAMNFHNFYQSEVQAAYWQGTQTSIHAVINYFTCPNDGCSDVVTLILAQITADLMHDSFVARAGHDAAFRYLAQIGVPLDTIFQFCDNCSSQYKSRRPFAEMARSPLNIIRVFFGEKHGKSQCDGFFGRLKAWMSYKIKARHVIITNANDFFRCCQEEYQTEEPQPGKCQHYRVVFQYLKPSDIRRHHDCDLDQAVTGTQSFYTVRNTEHPLKLKVRHTACLCEPCILENGEQCKNAMFTEPWKEVDLVPVRGESRCKHLKRKHPNHYVSTQRRRPENPGGQKCDVENPAAQECDDENPAAQECDVEIDYEDVPQLIINDDSSEDEDLVDLTGVANVAEDDIFIDLTGGVKEMNQKTDDISLANIEDTDVIITEDYNINTDIGTSHPIVTDEEEMHWESMLGALEGCKSDIEFEKVAFKLQKKLKPLRPRKQVYFNPEVDYIDSAALESLPLDGPQDLCPIMTTGDGNCMCRALSRIHVGDESMHIELRVRMVIEGVINKKHYISHESLSRGAINCREEETIPYMYVTYSDHYVNGQRITPILWIIFTQGSSTTVRNSIRTWDFGR